jgi:hypothetical protein
LERTTGRPPGPERAHLNGHTSRSSGDSCPFWHTIHPFLTHYQTDNADGTCAPQGTTGQWWADSGFNEGWQRWRVDLSRYAGKAVRVSITCASDGAVQLHGVFVDDIVVSTGRGSTSFEQDGNPRDGWTGPRSAIRGRTISSTSRSTLGAR